YVQAKSRTKVTVTGLVPGAPTCVTLGTSHAPGTASLLGTATANILLPAGTANRVISATDGSTTATVTVKVLDAKTLGIVVSTLRPHAGGTFTIRVTGLAPRETVHVTYAGKTIR